MWNNKNVITEADGNIEFNPPNKITLLQGNNSQNIIGINSGSSDTQGGYIRLYGADTNADKGGVIIGASDGTAVKTALKVMPDGTAKINDKKIITELNYDEVSGVTLATNSDTATDGRVDITAAGIIVITNNTTTAISARISAHSTSTPEEEVKFICGENNSLIIPVTSGNSFIVDSATGIPSGTIKFIKYF